MSDETTPKPPLLRVVKGDPTAEELAALIAVVAAKSSGGAPDHPKPRSQWGHPVRQHRGAHRVGPGQWRASSW